MSKANKNQINDPAVQKEYLSESAMHGDQANQKKGYIYAVDGVGHFEKLSTSTGASVDYKQIGVLKEHQIKGLALRESVTTSKALDFNAYSLFELTMTAATDFTFSNLPTGDDVKIITLMLTGDFAWQFLPTDHVTELPGDTYDGTLWNRIQIEVINGTAASENVLYQITNIPA